jgi:threonine aldolase
MQANTIDLRSDTVTKPSKEMREAMMHAEVGDDVFGEDPSINALQDYAAHLFGMEAALFCSSGTQTNQIGIKLHTQPGSEVICDARSHVYLYEGGGIAFNSGASVKLIQSERGMFTANDVLNSINEDNVHFPNTQLVCIENTVNKGGGACWDWEEILKIKAVCQQYNLPFHLDGARLFNALVAKNQNPRDYGNVFDTISICLSKGLGAPVGSLLLGSAKHIYQAKRIRKVMGGGMRQAGFLAAAGLFALQNNIDKLATDHAHAKYIESILKEQSWVEYIYPVETNLIIFKTTDDFPSEKLTAKLLKYNIKFSSMGKNLVRFVFHLNLTQSDVYTLEDCLQNIDK